MCDGKYADEEKQFIGQVITVLGLPKDFEDDCIDLLNAYFDSENKLNEHVLKIWGDNMLSEKKNRKTVEAVISNKSVKINSEITKNKYTKDVYKILHQWKVFWRTSDKIY